MGRRLPLLLAMALVAAMALVVQLTAHDGSATIVTAVIGTAAVLLAASAPAPTYRLTGDVERSDDPSTEGILDALDEPVIVIAGTRVTRANRAARALLGGHILDQDVRLAIRHPAAAERLMQGDDGGTVELIGLGARDQHWAMRVTATGDHRLIHLSDRTAGAAADRIRVDFVANASHELRTPLASLLGFIETLQEGAGDDPPTRSRFLSVMNDEAQRMERLVGDLMSLSRIEAEKFRIPDTAVDLVALARDVCTELSAGGGTRGHDLTMAAEGSAEVLGDRVQLSQLLHNLAGNAMKYGRAGTPVTIAIAREGDDLIRLSVSDEGDGIPPEHLPRLTERFYRVDPGRSRAVGGTGLGLAIVKHIVERHRGRLQVASVPGEGSVFTVLLPAA